MKRRTRMTVALATAGALGVGGLAAAVPAIAGVGPFGHGVTTATSNGPGDRGNGMGPGDRAGNGIGIGAQFGTGMGLRDGTCQTLADVPSGELTEAQRSSLAAMVEEEKLAGDLYRAFAEKYPAPIFDRIVKAEEQHLATVQTLLTRYGVTDPTSGKPAGQFTDPATQATYDTLLAQGLASQDAALAVGEQVEKADIADLQSALKDLTAPDVQRVYEHLLAASRQHLTAFTAWLT